jgi:hypothetical protein
VMSLRNLIDKSMIKFTRSITKPKIKVSLIKLLRMLLQITCQLKVKKMFQMLKKEWLVINQDSLEFSLLSMLQIKLPNTRPKWIEWKKINLNPLEAIELKAPWEVIKMAALEMINPWLEVQEFTLL